MAAGWLFSMAVSKPGLDLHLYRGTKKHDLSVKAFGEENEQGNGLSQLYATSPASFGHFAHMCGKDAKALPCGLLA